MSATASIVLGALRDALPVNPWLAALWLLSALCLAALLVYGWHRLLGDREHRASCDLKPGD